jgi:hypothetical protein
MLVAAIVDPRFASKRGTSRAFNLEAPTGGLNKRDAFTDMDQKDAVALVNVFPEANYVAVRKGHAEWATGMGAAVRSLMTWNGLTGADKLFAGAGTKIWNVTSNGAAVQEVTGLANVDFQWTNMKTAGGMFLCMVNGADDYRTYDGTSFATPVITGATSSTFTQICQFKERLWFAVADSLDLYYLDLQAVSGAATVFPLGSVFRRGGHVVGLGSFSNDAGEGPDDYFTIITSNGEIAVYQGTDPNSATTWSLVGRFDVGMPIGRRSCVRWNGDLAIITQDGVISMQAALRFDRSSIQRAAITGKIQTLFSQYAQSYKSNFGWQACVYPRSRYLIVNVPQVTGNTQIQLVMNTITGAWTQFEGMSAGCWGTANDLLYFGGNSGTVYRADVGYLDDGGQIDWQIQTAWQMLWGPANKFFTMVRPVMLTGGGVGFRISVRVDFEATLASGMVTVTPLLGSTWPWTWPGTWGGQSVLDAKWQSVGAIGTWAGIYIEGATSGGPCQINNFEVVAQQGGIL